MPRVHFSDVTPPNNRRSIRDVPIPKGGRRKTPVVIRPKEEYVPKTEEEVIENKNEEAYEYYYPKENKPPSRRAGGSRFKKQWLFGGAIAVLVVAFIVGMMTVFASATIAITPKSQSFDVDMKITATSDKQDDTVRYEIIKLSEQKTATVPASGEEAAEVKASGKIVIYNNFSTESQRLITRTRFESPEGLIYRIPDSVVVPGKTVKGGVSTPGSIEVEVFADEAGEKYNIKKTDFTIPGFKTDAARYKNFYARSSTNMTGGFVGKVKTVLPADKQAALQSIDTEAQADLKKDLETKVPDGLALFSDSIMYKSEDLPQKEDGSSVVLGKEVTAYAIMLNAQDLSQKITGEYVSGLAEWKDIKSIVKDFSLLKITGKPDNLDAIGKIDLKISGKAKVSADIDTSLINQKLVGAPKKAAGNLMDEFAGISSIRATVRPIWKQSFPEDAAKIHVQIVNE